MVPKPTMYISWLQLFQIFSIELWLFILFSFLFVGIYFLLEVKLRFSDQSPSVIGIYGLLVCQGLNESEVPRGMRGRFVFAIILVLLVLYSSLFGSGIVGKMISASYINDVRTMENLAKSDLPFHNFYNPLNFQSRDLFTEFELVIYSRYIDFMEAYKIPATKKASVCYRTPTGFTDNVYQNMAQFVKKMDDELNIEFLTTAVTTKEYQYFISKISAFSIRCKDVGLYMKWEWDFYRASNRMDTLVEFLDNSLPQTDVRKLSFDHVKGVFIFWSAGLLISIITFIAEVLNVYLNEIFLCF